MNRSPIIRRAHQAAVIALAAATPWVAWAQAAPSHGTTTPNVDGTGSRLEVLAPKIIQRFVPMRPGDLVAIHGGPHMVAAMEALAVEVNKAGGHSLLLLDSPRTIRLYYKDAAMDQYLTQPARSWEDFRLQHVDVEINLPVFDDVRPFFADIPPARQTQVQQSFAASQAPFVAQRNETKMRRLTITPPNPVDAEFSHVDPKTYERMIWDAINADYEQIHTEGEAIKQIFQHARRIRITSPEGTDLVLAIGDRPVIVDAGIVPPGASGLQAARSAQLPGGAVFVAPIEGSVNGKVRAAEDQCDHPVKDEAIDVRNGNPENVHAATDEACVQRSVQAAGRFGYIEIGLNPALRTPEASAQTYLLPTGAGIVSVAFGPNQELGGENKGAPPWFIVLRRANVEVDGRAIVKDGKLVP